jgi:hypothetical protein
MVYDKPVLAVSVILLPIVSPLKSIQSVEIPE